MKTTFLLLLNLIVTFAMAQNTAEIDTYMQSYTGENPGAALAIIKEGKIVFSRSYGLSELETKTKINEHTNFRLASVTKQFTAAAILQLIGQGKLTLQTKLRECFPSLPKYADGITIQQLLNHTSGIMDYDELINEHADAEQLSDRDVLKSCHNFDKTYFTPGSKYQYSNTAYVLLGLIIEKYSGLTYPDYLSKYIFGPSGMKTSLAFVSGTNKIKNRAFGYALINNNWIRKDQSSTSATLGDGGIYSNIADLFSWDQALYKSTVLPQHVWQTAFARQRLNDGSEIPYGFGWHLKKNARGEEVVYHTGSTTSFRNVFYRIPSAQLSLIILTNRNKPQEVDLLKLAEVILDAYSSGTK